MPQSESHESNRARAKPRQESRQRVPSTDRSQTASSPAPDIQEPQQPWESLLGSDYGQGSLERHAALLGDGRISHRMHTSQRAAIVMRLQRDYGNRYVQRLAKHISGMRAQAVQATLTIGPAGDKYEQVPDRVHETVSAPGQGAAQRQAREEEEDLQMKPVAQRPVAMEGGDVDRAAESSIQQATSGGQAGQIVRRAPMGDEEEMPQAKPMQESAPVELTDRSGREQDEFSTAVDQVAEIRETLETRAKDPPPEPTFWQKLRGAKEWDYGSASVKVGQLGDALDEANEQLDAGGDPNALYPMAVNAVDTTAGQLVGKVEDHYSKELDVTSALIASGVAAAVKTSIANRTLEPAQLVKGAYLGEGGGGEVYEYSYLAMHQKIAGKETLRPGKQEQLKAESDLMRDLPENRHLLKGLGAVEKGRTIAFMELAGKGDVRGVISEMKRPENGLGPDEKASIMRYILKGTLEGLEALHKSGMVHADVKGDNIFLDDELNPVLADFGLTAKEGMTKATKGTVEYMAPELATEGSSQASDMWAVGEMLLMALTGRNSIQYLLDTDRRVAEIVYPVRRKGGFTDEQLAGKVDPGVRAARHPDPDNDHTEAGITENIASFVEGALTQDQDERMTATEGLSHRLLEEVDDDGAKRLIRQLLDAMARRKAMEAERVAEEEA